VIESLTNGSVSRGYSSTQLSDGGHVIGAVEGPRVHRWLPSDSGSHAPVISGEFSVGKSVLAFQIPFNKENND